MPLLGCVADDFTGATDLASMLVRQGMRVVQLIGAPSPGDPAPEADAIVVALKSRTAPPRDAVRESLAAMNWLREAGCRQFFFKYCSTFDSTDEGNIGPVADAFVDALDCGFALVCPAFPANGRSVFQGHLFVGSALLSESGMENHPLTPMRDSNLVRVLGRQTEGTVGLLPFATVQTGATAIRAAVTGLRDRGFRYGVADAVTDADLHALGEAASGHALITGGSGIAIGLPANFRRAGLLPERSDSGALPKPAGHAAVLAGSCSRATLFQIATARDHAPTLELDALATPDAAALAREAIEWAAERLGDRPIVIAASTTPDRVAALQARLGREEAGALVEKALAEIAAALVEKGVGRLVVAGGETSGAVVTRLGVRRLRIGAEIDPGVPWTFAEGRSKGLHLALKSGNFGARDFFLKAFDMLADA
jgi:uncharacterized protein YgbK (DUF1537 family)